MEVRTHRPAPAWQRLLSLALNQTDTVDETTTPSPVAGSSVVTTTNATLPAHPDDGTPVDVSLVWDGAYGTLTVPFDYDDPDGAAIDVPLARREADDPGRASVSC